MLKLIVLDCDGVMFDSKDANCRYYNHLLNHFGLPPMSGAEEDFVHMHNVADSIRHIFRHYEKPTFDQVDAFRLQGDYTPFLPYMTMAPDLLFFLEQVSPTHHLAISTNRTNTMIPLLQTYNIEHYFGKVVTAATAKRPKPAPDGLLEILDHFQCRAEEAVFIGDSILDEQHAASCGVDLIAFNSPQLNARFHVQNFTQVLGLDIFTS